MSFVGSASNSVPFLRLSSVRDREGRPVILLFGRRFPSSITPDIITSISAALSSLEEDPALTLVYLHACTNSPGFFQVRSFRSAWDSLPQSLRQRVACIVAVHVSVGTRTAVYANSTWMQCNEYSKLVYCDLICDMEKLLAVDALIAGVEDEDVQYDCEMRAWVCREDELRPTKFPDPRKPIINLQNVDFSKDDGKMSTVGAQATETTPGETV